MSSILITRFLLNVHEAAYMTTVDSSIGTLSFGAHSRGIARARVDTELPTITFGDPDSAVNTEISLQLDRSLPDPEGLPNRTHEWDDADEEDWDGAEDGSGEVEMQVMGMSSAVDDPASGRL